MSNNKQQFLRFTPSQRLEHVVLIVSFTLLALTGLPQKYAMNELSQAIINLFGGIETTRIIHRVSATIFVLQSIYHFIVVGYKIYVRRLEASMVPGIKDAQDAVQSFKHNLGLAKEAPKMPRYNFTEKAEYLAMLWGLVLMALTGFMLWNPIITARFLPGCSSRRPKRLTAPKPCWRCWRLSCGTFITSTSKLGTHPCFRVCSRVIRWHMSTVLSWKKSNAGRWSNRPSIPQSPGGARSTFPWLRSSVCCWWAGSSGCSPRRRPLSRP